ncbi:amino acid adenylation domain-containing protein [Rhodanobacter ginsenosidimutans]|uniref:Amino acid adenylation domain-containing protein n=1 Tax=Rhodanobacter ginsenosidimutans TaxID=490571 RepID=A0ABW0JT56_9GAMM
MNQDIEGVAIVGMAGRFPDADSVDALWRNLLAGRESITRFTPEQLSPSIAADLRAHPRYVPARGVIADADRFDAAFFGIPAREALLMDPQQRVFLELCWNALENAGVDSQQFPGSVGVYAGTSNNGYRKLVDSRADLVQAAGEFATMLANEKDYVATRVAHRLDLTGPALSLHTACSTSLVAIAQAWYALMSWQCDLALAGGINIVVPQASGYLPVEGGMESEDGHCRPFDASANGTLFSSGGAVVALKRVAEAIADGDTIYAVIRGVGVNNDGGDKASFTAPSVRGQAAVIAQALASADVEADSIGYVEAHGTATPLGDPIEVAALTRAFGASPATGDSCWLGSVKGNLGHLNAASGVTGLIKAALALHHGRIPPTLHYRTPNPEIDFASGRFKIADQLIDWPRGARPRRAGVSSFGVGGTNAHVILEEAPLPEAAAPGRPFTLLPLSARDEPALLRRAAELADALADRPDASLPDIGYTLAVGRRALPVRGCVVARDVADARARLAELSAQAPVASSVSTVFLFPGQGSQHAHMARELIDSEPVFRDAFERCCAIASTCLGRDLRSLILPAAGDEEAANAALADTRFTQPALFAVEYALADLWESWGVQPAAMIGHSIGEYVAACRAGVFSLDDALKLVVARGAAMAAQPRGAMLAVRLDAESLSSQLPPGVEIAGHNAPALTVVSGSEAAIDGFAQALSSDSIASTRLRVSHAFHSAAMDGALPIFRQAFEGVMLHAPQRLFYSCVSGAPITATEATSMDYWCAQLRQPVHFVQAVQDVLARQEKAVLLEVGPAQALTGLARGMLDGRGRAVASLGPAARPGDASEHLQRALGECWCAGVAPAWADYFTGQQRRRVPLPGYPFRGERYWIEPPAAASATQHVTEGKITMHEGLPSTIAPAATPAVPARASRLAQELRELFENLSGETIAPAHEGDSFLSLGLDSLALTQATLEIERRYGVKLKFRRLMEDLDSVSRLVALLDETLPAEPVAAAAPMIAAPAPTGTSTDPSALAQLIQSQMALMNQQAELLRALAGGTAAVAPVEAPAQVAAGEVVPEANLVERPFGASARIVTARHGELNPAQRAWVDTFSQAYGQRTARSKAFSQQHRALMADPRVVTGFNPLWKELTYPIVVERSQGARLWDLDGNEYIDLLNGFGVNFLGYQPEFITAALHAQLDAGMEIGPQHPLTADVAQLINDMTGMPRVAFCNTGSEAVMGAMRIARTVTGRKTIVIFRDSYHGIFDEVIVRGTRTLRSIAAAPGILANAVENVLVLDYGSDEALRVIHERAHELAAVMIEPVQSKHPTLQPHAFVRALRELCNDGGCALIFDEVITGFRMAPGGAQEYYGVRADIATYGKIIGGGLPFAAIAGGTRWMDALDGGHWQFGDESYPEAGVTYFAGTFVRHPLALAAAHAALSWVKQQGPALQAGLNARTTGLIDQLNAVFKARRAPLTALGYSSLWRILVDDDQPCASLFWYRLRHEGLHVYEQFNCFLSVAHGDAEVARIVEAVTAAVDALMDGHVLTPRDASTEPAHAPAVGVEADASAIGLPAEAPLSEGQLEKWLGGQYGGAAELAFNESMALRLEGALDAVALRQALQTVWSRHEAFRLSFAADGKSQRVNDDTPLPLAEMDYAGYGDEAQTRFTAYCEAQMGLPFDTTRAPLVRFSLVRLGERSHGLHVISHHLVMDGWSVAVFMDELARCYNAAVAGRAPDLPVAESFRAYVLDERSRQIRTQASQLDYWKAVYATPPAALQLPGDHPQAALDFAAATERHAFPPALTAALKQEARRLGVSLYSLLLAGFGAWISRLTGQHDFAVGIPFAGQALAGSHALIGDGVNTLPVRLKVDPAATTAALVSRTHAALLDASEHQDITFMNILRALGLHRRAGGTPLTGVIFNLNPRVPDVTFSGLEHELHDCRRAALAWDLFFNLNDTAKTLTLDLHYATARFDNATIRRWIQTYEAVLADMLGNGTQVAQRGERTGAADTLIALLDAQVKRTPQRIAVACEGRTLSYAELDRRATAVAQALRARGVGKGQLVGVSMPRSEHMLIAVLGVMKNGAAYVPLDPAFPEERLRYMAEHAQLRHVLTAEVDALPASVARGLELLAIADIETGTHAAAALPVVEGSDLAYVLYTSGSTGQPKGVCVSHRNLANFLTSMRAQPGIDEADVLCAVTTLSFDIAGLELYLPLIAGARVVVASDAQQRDPDALLQLLRECQASVLQTTPALLRMLADHDATGVMRKLKLLVGGEELPRATADLLAGKCRELWNMYGPTETTIWSTLMQVQPGPGPVPLGRPIARTRIHILDEQRQAVPQGEVGEIWIGGDGVADGYLFRDDLTAERFRPDPFATDGSRMYRTGDLGSERDGVLFFHGRVDHQLKVRGYRIEPGDIEAAAGTDPAVRECVAVAQPFGDNDVRLVLYVAAAVDDPAWLAQLRDRLRDRLPAYMLPQHIERLESLPKTPNGKIDRKALPLPTRAAEFAAPSPGSAKRSTQMDLREIYIADIWRELIGVEDARESDNFFDVGGHSLLAVEFATRVQRERGVRIHLLDIATGTLASLARELPETAATAAPGTPSFGARLRRLLGLG